MFDNSEYPESWGLGFIVPIFGDASDAKHYRGITLNNFLAKTYSQIVLNRITAWTEKYEINIKMSSWISEKKEYEGLYIYLTCNNNKSTKFLPQIVQYFHWLQKMLW